MRASILGALAAAALLIPACVELTGQRITWFYDTARDTLHVLIHYDGIHEAEAESFLFRGAKHQGSEQIPAFVENGDIMISGWPFHFGRDRIREAAGETVDPLVTGIAELSPAIETRILGFYREPDGRVGAAQMVSIPRATEFFRRVNGLISLALLAQRSREPNRSEMPRTMERLRDAARTDHQWIAIDGQSLRVSWPVHPGEWAQAKATFVRDVFEEVVETIEDPDADGESLARTLTEMLGSAPVSYLDEGNRIALVLVRPDRPSTSRIDIREAYEPSLEEIVARTAIVDLDETLSRSLLYPGSGLPPTWLHSSNGAHPRRGCAPCCPGPRAQGSVCGPRSPSTWQGSGSNGTARQVCPPRHWSCIRPVSFPPGPSGTSR